jgi:ribosomal protein S18 acetylase RimI-like enzyme
MTAWVGGIQVRRVTEDEWQTLRSVRLSALRDAPYAFASTYEREAAWDDEAWRRSVRRAAWFLAWERDTPVGIVAGLADENAPVGERHLISLWVAPHRRGRGVAKALYGAAAEWARQEGATSLVLWVADSNDAAHQMYEKLGFVSTGARQPLPSDPTRWEEQFRVSLLLTT